MVGSVVTMVNWNYMKAYIKILFILYKIRFLGLHFWTDPNTAKKRTEETIVGDIIGLFGIVFAVTILVLVKSQFLAPLSWSEKPKLKMTLLILLTVVSVICGYSLLKKVSSITKQYSFDEMIVIDNYSKRSTFVFFLYTLLSPLMFLLFLGIILKIIASIF